MTRSYIPQMLSPEVLEQIFLGARTFNIFTDQPVSDEVLRQLYDLLKWGPTAMNAQPGRFVFLRSEQARARLLPALSPGNRDKTRKAPITVIVAQDQRFFDHLPTQFPAYDAKPLFENDQALAERTALLNTALQAAYLVIAARSLGLDAGVMAGFDAEKVNREFFPEGDRSANLLVNLGYGDPAGNHPRGPRLDFETAAQIL